MFVRTQQCKLSHKMMIRLKNFLYVFNLRQGTILIAVHQIALSSFVLIILLVGISHVGEMLSMLHNDMEDDAERRGFYEITYGEHLTFHEVTVIFLYTSTILTAIYLMCCISLLHGAVKYKREYVLPWIMAACVAVVLLIVAIVIGDGYPCVVNLFGGHNLYHFGCALFVLTFIYAICAVSSFALETGGGRCARASLANDERGERLLLLDHAAHSSLLSAAQLSKLSHGTRTQFV
ncbi:uncharacterized protein LOC125065616 isoform X2 [Vanessa atalanta]|uniref:uncharacterized protein LOC125065616 isoform X2 n=1 Tax=Vanessa atalanta TaxID=42275 RepID=UPI001FCD95B8|nr:uncharacterized protein LOC125065616 isoform X2 [Vanessa atalanta]